MHSAKCKFCLKMHFIKCKVYINLHFVRCKIFRLFFQNIAKLGTILLNFI